MCISWASKVEGQRDDQWDEWLWFKTPGLTLKICWRWVNPIRNHPGIQRGCVAGKSHPQMVYSWVCHMTSMNKGSMISMILSSFCLKLSSTAPCWPPINDGRWSFALSATTLFYYLPWFKENITYVCIWLLYVYIIYEKNYIEISWNTGFPHVNSVNVESFRCSNVFQWFTSDSSWYFPIGRGTDLVSHFPRWAFCFVLWPFISP